RHPSARIAALRAADGTKGSPSAGHPHPPQRHPPGHGSFELRTMKVAYFDCPSGAAGDMIMASLIDAGAPVDRRREELAKLGLPGWELRVREVMKGPFRATKVDVDIDRSAHHAH